MITFDTKQIREGLEILISTRTAIRESPRFDQNKWIHKCGTPACTLGHSIAVSNGKLRVECHCICADIGEDVWTDAAELVWGVSRYAAAYLCEAATNSTNLHGKTGDLFNILNPYARLRGKAGALDRITRAIDYMRWKLTVLEHEQGRRAQDIAVGEERRAMEVMEVMI